MTTSYKNRLNALAAHSGLILYTCIVLFPVFVVVINSFKTRKAIFRDPLALPNSESFSLIGYETVLKQGDFFPLFSKFDDCDRCIIILYPNLWGDGRLCTGRISFQR